MPNRDLVVIGGSAGAVEPLKAILSNLPPDLRAAIAVVLHVPAGSTGIHKTVMRAASPLPVETAVDGMPLVRGRVHLAPPGRHLLVDDGHLALGGGPRENLVRPSIDPLFRSAAVSHGPRAIGVILSGMLNDGAAGLEAIKRCGGIALVQAPREAHASEMPLAALEATSVDLSADARQLAEAIVRFVAEEVSGPGKVPDDVKLEVTIAAGGQSSSAKMAELGKPVALTCPDCGGVLTEVNGKPSRFRCQVGHAYSSRALLKKQEAQVDEAMRVALRIIEERAELVARMGRDAAELGRSVTAHMYSRRAEEYRAHEEVLRQAILRSMQQTDTEDETGAVALEALGAD
jgi:two-component system, chemotaxis family, protein-glutamate methylesterase/glutaminase